MGLSVVNYRDVSVRVIEATHIMPETTSIEYVRSVVSADGVTVEASEQLLVCRMGGEVRLKSFSGDVVVVPVQVLGDVAAAVYAHAVREGAS